MRAGDLLGLPVDAAVADINVTRVDIDSRTCQPGSVFFAMPGTLSHGHRYVDDAISKGAVVIVTSEPVEASVPVVLVAASELHQAMVDASYRIVGGVEQLALVGVTGTNGKTSVTHFVANICRRVGVPAQAVGTLTNVRTTPAPPELARVLRSAQDDMSAPGVVALEVSSHALDQGRVDGLQFAVGVFTNLSHDHLDYHETMDSYFAAKVRLFDPSRTQRAIINSDDEWGRRLLSIRSDALAVSLSDLGNVEVGNSQISFMWRGHDIHAPVGGSFNVTNLHLACEAVRAMGVDENRIAEATRSLVPVPGRFEVINTAPLVIVDFAHTPEGLDGVLSEVAQRTQGRVIVVFGCGGDRDRDKRPLMGGIATRRATITIVTSDNPRSEDPREIIREIVSGAEGDADIRIEVDRRSAIALARDLATSHDAVVIAGKGHEKTQETKGSVVDFDDVVVAQELFGRR